MERLESGLGTGREIHSTAGVRMGDPGSTIDGMSERHDQLRNSVTRDYGEMRELLSQLTPEMMPLPATDGWTVGQLAGHIAVSPRGLIFTNHHVVSDCIQKLNTKEN